MMLRSDSKFPMDRTYVIKFSSDASPEHLSGRIENLVDGNNRAFASTCELLQLINSDLSAIRGSRSAASESQHDD